LIKTRWQKSTINKGPSAGQAEQWHDQLSIILTKTPRWDTSWGPRKSAPWWPWRELVCLHRKVWHTGWAWSCKQIITISVIRPWTPRPSSKMAATPYPTKNATVRHQNYLVHHLVTLPSPCNSLPASQSVTDCSEPIPCWFDKRSSPDQWVTPQAR